MTDYLKLIVENDFNEYELVTETDQSTGSKQLLLRGPYIVANKKNGNNRIYPLNDLREEVNRFVTEMVTTNRALGELEHPDYSHIDPSKAAIRIKSIKEDRHNEGVFIGESVILTSDPSKNIKGTPQGDILASLVQHGTKMGFSTRGVGKIVEEKFDGKKESIVRNYRMSTVDCVCNPSIGQFVEGILESKNFLVDQYGDIMEVQYNKLSDDIATLPTKDKSVYLSNVISEFLKGI